MQVVIKGVVVELPAPEAERLMQLGYAHPMETASAESGDRFSSTPTRRGRKPGMDSKPPNLRPVSSKQATKQPSTRIGDLKGQTPSGTESKSTRKAQANTPMT
jgi:hypothetical protein